jgi:3-isopropylmalate/(R)-2-methylmalate dehydratase small subunit
MNALRDVKGRAWVLGDNINTDLIHPPAFFSLDEETLKQGIRIGMERIGSDQGLEPSVAGLVIVAGENFGCGSSRESSVRALFASGVRAIVAKSFGRIFYRSLVNRGIAPVICHDVQDKVSDQDPIEIRMEQQLIVVNDSVKFPFVPFDTHVKKILACGGLIPYMEGGEGFEDSRGQGSE